MNNDRKDGDTNADRVNNWYQKKVTDSIPMMIVHNWYQKNEGDEPLRLTDVFGVDFIGKRQEGKW